MTNGRSHNGVEEMELSPELRAFQEQLESLINEKLKTQDQQVILNTLGVFAKCLGGFTGTFIYAGADQQYLHDYVSQNLTLGIREAMHNLHAQTMEDAMGNPSNLN